MYTTGSRSGTAYQTVSAPGVTDGSVTDNNRVFGKFGEIYALIDLGSVYMVSAVKVADYYVTPDCFSFREVTALLDMLAGN